MKYIFLLLKVIFYAVIYIPLVVVVISLYNIFAFIWDLNFKNFRKITEEEFYWIISQHWDRVEIYYKNPWHMLINKVSTKTIR